MISKTINLSDDGSVTLSALLYEKNPEINWDKRPAVLVCPGGAYKYCSPREADPIAMQYTAAGFNTFVLRYSIEENAVFPRPLCELSQAVALIRQNSDEWGVTADQIAVCGFSAGGHLTASLGTLWNHPEITEQTGFINCENEPNALILGYPVISTSWIKSDGSLDRLIGDRDFESTQELLNCHKNVGSHTPPTFLFHTYMDNVVPVEDSLLMASALAEKDVPFELHIYPNGGHGLSLATPMTGPSDKDAAGWMELSVIWLWRLFGQPEREPPADFSRAKFR